MIASRFEQDLKLLTREQLTEKYGAQDWDGILSQLAQGRAVPTIERPGAEVTFIEPSEDFPIPEKEPEPQPPPYRGRAFGRFVMVRRLEQEHTGRLVMPSRIAGTSDVGWIASVGEECKYVKAGNVIVFDQYAAVGREVRLVDEQGLPGTFLIVEEPDILAVLEKV